ncbi:site-specific integrase [Aggregatibacter actinomycetemcomitans]|uniref:tyrosine-type recombinase/integrase n=1 Tax=Aggregatibacter actinomycetemcomitans TaxID=714 RepID=UPI00197BAF08|nr:site-specific integrase [Aggregatibacter actinomycetemcomitans]MBN6067408.1 site-specific integrase [Aggregatibacter actinomycetemcomitans]MBN6086090.1 site-specific integrase [Aggregatibacter actinomycetemcomitans]
MTLHDIIIPWLDFASSRFAVKTNKYYRFLLNKHFSQFFGLNLKKLSPKLIFDTALKIESKKEAKQTLTVLSNVFDYALAVGLAKSNPAARLRKFIAPHIEINHPHLRAREELAELLRRIDGNKSDRTVSNALLTIIYTAQRRAEIVGAKWEEINFEKRIWTIPTKRMKMKLAQEIPITDTIYAILKEQKGLDDEFVFPSKHRKAPVYYEAPLVLLHNLGYRKRQTLHGFRHIFSTAAHENKFAYDLIEKQLAHKIHGVRGVYNKADYFEDRIKMMAWYDGYITSLRGK